MRPTVLQLPSSLFWVISESSRRGWGLKIITDQKEGSLGLQNFLNKQHWFPVGFGTALCLVPSSSAGKGVQRYWAPRSFDFWAPTMLQKQGVLFGWWFLFGCFFVVLLGFFVWFCLGVVCFFSPTKWFLILRAFNLLQMARQVLQTQYYWGITSRVRKAICDMSPLEVNMEELCLQGGKFEVSKYFSRSKIKGRSSHGCLLFFFNLSILQFLCLNSAETYLPSPLSYWEHPGSEDEWVTNGDREVISPNT